jgi:hypothetical protein
MKQARTNTILGVSAMGLSAVTAAVVIWQAKVDSDHLAAAVWPYVQAWPSRSTAPPRFEISLVNAGVGPAIIRHFSVRVDGSPVRSWREFLAAVSKEETVRAAAFNEGVVQGSGWVMTPGSSVSAFRTHVPAAVNALSARDWNRVDITFCYCSIFDRCWVSDWEVSAREEPTRVRSCPSDGRFGVDWSELDADSAQPE